MKTFARRLAATIAGTGMAAACMVLLPTASASAAVPQPNACDNAFWQAQAGSLEATSVPADGSAVNPGNEIQVTATWDTSEYIEVRQELTCARLENTIINDIGDENLNPPNDGTYNSTITVPMNAPVGSEFCVRVRLEGHPTFLLARMQKSEILCYEVVDSQRVVEAPATEVQAPEIQGASQSSDPIVQVPVVSSANDSVSLPLTAAPTENLAANDETPAPLAELPRTGASPQALLVTGFGLLLAGLAALVFGRRPSHA